MSYSTTRAEANVTVIGTQSAQKDYFEYVINNSLDPDLVKSIEAALEITTITENIRQAYLQLNTPIKDQPARLAQAQSIKELISQNDKDIRKLVTADARAKLHPVSPYPDNPSLMMLLENSGEAVVNILKQNMRARAATVQKLSGGDNAEINPQVVDSLNKHIRRGIRANASMGVFIDNDSAGNAEIGKWSAMDTANSIEPSAIVELTARENPRLAAQIFLLEQARRDFAQEGMLVQVEAGGDKVDPRTGFTPEIIGFDNNKYDPQLAEISRTRELSFNLQDKISRQGLFDATADMLEVLVNQGIRGATIVDGKLQLSFIPMYADLQGDFSPANLQNNFSLWRQSIFKAIAVTEGIDIADQASMDKYIDGLVNKGYLSSRDRILINYYEDIAESRGAKDGDPINGPDPNLSADGIKASIEHSANLASLIRDLTT